MTAIHVAWDPAYSVDRSAVLTARRRGRAYEVLSAFHFPARTPYPRQAGGLVSHLRDLRRRLIGNLGDLDLGESPAAARQRWHDAQDLSFLVRMDASNERTLAQVLALKLATDLPFEVGFEPVRFVFSGNPPPYLGEPEKDHMRLTHVGKEWSDSDLLAKITQRLITGGPSVRNVMDELSHYRVTRSAAGNPVSGAEAGWHDDYVTAVKLATLGDSAPEESLEGLGLMGGKFVPPELDDEFRPADSGGWFGNPLTRW